jgi:hypothetical protein
MVQSLTQRQCTIVATILALILAEVKGNRISGMSMCTVMVQLVGIDGNDAWESPSFLRVLFAAGEWYSS